MSGELDAGISPVPHDGCNAELTVKFEPTAAAPRIDDVGIGAPCVGGGIGMGVGVGVGAGVGIGASESWFDLSGAWAAETLHAANRISSTVGANAFVFNFNVRMTPLLGLFLQTYVSGC